MCPSFVLIYLSFKIYRRKTGPREAETDSNLSYPYSTLVKELFAPAMSVIFRTSTSNNTVISTVFALIIWRTKSNVIPWCVGQCLKNGLDSVLFNPGCQKQFPMLSFRAGFDITKNETHFGPPHSQMSHFGVEYGMPRIHRHNYGPQVERGSNALLDS